MSDIIKVTNIWLNYLKKISLKTSPIHGSFIFSLNGLYFNLKTSLLYGFFKLSQILSRHNIIDRYKAVSIALCSALNESIFPFTANVYCFIVSIGKESCDTFISNVSTLLIILLLVVWAKKAELLRTTINNIVIFARLFICTFFCKNSILRPVRQVVIMIL